jgi:glycine/D-amino acid oxidase-like deaminating enzyme
VATGTSADVNVLVIGGGVLGTSVAFHLARAGCPEVCLLEARAVGSQSSSQAAGFIRVHRASDLSTEMALHSVALFERFREETGHDVGVRRVGGVLVAQSERSERLLRSWPARAARHGVACELLKPEEARARWPLLRTPGVRSLVYEPRDLYLDAAEVAVGYARAARTLGAAIREQTRVVGLEVSAGRVAAVRTDRERIAARWVVLAGGAWGPRLAARFGFHLAAVPVHHQLHITAPIPGASPELPMFRFPDLAAYLRPARGGLMVGGYEPNPTTYDPAEIADGLDMAALTPDRGALRAQTDSLLPFFPALEGAPIAREQQGLPTLTADGAPILGEVPGIVGLIVASGDNVGGVSTSPAVGHAVAELILRGRAPFDLTSMAVDRFGDRLADVAALRRAGEAGYASFGRSYLEDVVTLP